MIGGWHGSFDTTTSWPVGTFMDDCESLFPTKKSDSSKSALVGELLDDDCEPSSSFSNRGRYGESVSMGATGEGRILKTG